MPYRIINRSAITLCLALSLSDTSMARELPKWELGIGLTTLNMPYYRGSDQNKTYLLPYPYIIYRGEYLNVDEDGVRGWLFKSDDIKLDLSLAGGVPVPSDQNGRRKGMTDLDPSIEFGPSLEIRLRETDNHALWLSLPLRAAYSVDGTRFEHQGWGLSPYLEYTTYNTLNSGWESSISLGPIFADDAYHDYFYGVTSQYATATRPAYQASSGYSGSRLTLFAKKQFNSFWLGAFIRFDNLNQAAFEDSPLVATHRYHLVGIAATWILNRSEERVYAP